MSAPPLTPSLAASPPSSPVVGGRVRVQTLVLIRWLALAGQTAAILIVRYGLGFPMDVMTALLAVAASMVLNLVLAVRYASTTRLSDAQAAVYLAYDTLQLAVLLYLTGGIENPFSILVLVPVTISATILSLRSTLSLGLLTLVSLTFLTFYHMPLPWAEPFGYPPLYLAGIWVALVLGMAFISIYAWRVAEESRRMADALAATQLALAREQRLSALGALAAAAAHELGTPLGTITLVAKELSRELANDSPLADDARLLVSQSERCREILAQLSRRPEGEASPFDRLALPTLLDSIVEPQRRTRVAVRIEAGGTGDGGRTEPPVVARRPEIVHGLGNLVENAVDFATSEVSVRAGWNAQRVQILITDDGPGFSPGILGALGEPYVTSRRDADGMGLGVFIAKTLLERTGATVSFGNAQGGGAQVAIEWPRALLEAGSTQERAARRR